MFEDKYEILAQLGQGGFATVYKVRDKQFGNIRAMRVLNTPILDTNDKVYRNWLRECGILMRLGNGNHPNIIHYYTPMLVDGRAYVEMDFIKGQDIGQLIHSHAGVVPLDEVLRMAEQISSALAFCHHDIYQYCMDRAADALQFDSQDAQKLVIDDATRARLVEKYKVVHNDIHQGNVMRQFDGRYLLIDFGLAIQGENGVIKSSRHEHGAPEYMAPEKWDNEALLTEQSDIYSFGILLYQCLAGCVPFGFNHKASNSISEMYAVQQAHKTKPPLPIKPLRQAAFEKKFPAQPYDEAYPDWLEKIIMRCLEKDPKDRFQNGKMLHDAIVEGMAGNESGSSKMIAEYERRIAELTGELSLYQSEFRKLHGLADIVISGPITASGEAMSEIVNRLEPPTPPQISNTISKATSLQNVEGAKGIESSPEKKSGSNPGQIQSESHISRPKQNKKMWLFIVPALVIIFLELGYESGSYSDEMEIILFFIALVIIVGFLLILLIPKFRKQWFSRTESASSVKSVVEPPSPQNVEVFKVIESSPEKYADSIHRGSNITQPNSIHKMWFFIVPVLLLALHLISLVIDFWFMRVILSYMALVYIVGFLLILLIPKFRKQWFGR